MAIRVVGAMPSTRGRHAERLAGEARTAGAQTPELVRRPPGDGGFRPPSPFAMFLRLLLALLVGTVLLLVTWTLVAALQTWAAAPAARLSPWPGARATLHRLVSACASLSVVRAFRDSEEVKEALALRALPGGVRPRHLSVQ